MDSIEYLSNYKNNQNHIEEFIEEYCNVGEEYRVYVSDLYKAYERYCNLNYISLYSPNKFRDYVMSIDGIIKSRFRMNEENRHGYIGIGLK